MCLKVSFKFGFGLSFCWGPVVNVNKGTYSVVLSSEMHSSNSILLTVSFPVIEKADDVVVSSPSMFKRDASSLPKKKCNNKNAL